MYTDYRNFETWGKKIYEREYPPAVEAKKIEETVSTIHRFAKELSPSHIAEHLKHAMVSPLKEKDIVNAQKSYLAFTEMMEKNPPKPPPKNLIFHIKTKDRTFNHVNDYALYDGDVFYRRRNQVDQDWNVMFVEGYGDTHLVEIYADGANFFGVNNKGTVLYKKILSEYLSIYEIEAMQYPPVKPDKPVFGRSEAHEFTIEYGFIWVRVPGGQWQPFFVDYGWPDYKPMTLNVKNNKLYVTDNFRNVYEFDVSEQSVLHSLEGQRHPYHNHCDYHAFTKDKKINWKKQFLTTPVLGNAVNVIRYHKLKKPQEAIGFAVGHRAAFAAHLADFANSEHPCSPGSEFPGSKKDNFSGVTTIYAVYAGERFIRFADAWLPLGFHKKSAPFIPDKRIDFPSNFDFEGLAASGGMVAMTGTDSNGNRRICFQMADFDSMDINIALPRIDLENVKKEVSIGRAPRAYPEDYRRLSPDKKWTDISLTGIDQSNVNYKEWTLLQTGPGNMAKEFRIATADGVGHFWKSLDNNADWQWRSNTEISR